MPTEIAVESKNLIAALDYAKRGIPVFPLFEPKADGTCSCGKGTCNVGKHPRTEHGFENATDDEKEVRVWWTRWPNANIGIPTGTASGWIVLDEDPRNGGDESLKDLQERYGPLPETLTHRTGGGGRHFFFKNCEGLRRFKIAGYPGLDIKADGGYIVAPPSVHRSGNCYEVLTDAKVADCPAWLLDLLIGKPSNPQTLDNESAILEGSRNKTVFRMAVGAADRGMSFDAVKAAIDVENETRCDPPLDEEEVRQIAENAVKSAERGREKNFTSDYKKRLSEVVVVSAAELRQRDYSSEKMAQLPVLGTSGFFIEGCTHLIAAYPKVGKTELLTRIVLDWGKSTLYITEESQQVFGCRVQKYPESYDYEKIQVVQGAGIGSRVLAGLIDSREEQVVVIDTVRSCLAIEDENNNSEVTNAMTPLITAGQRHGKTLIFVHHMRKGAGEHGREVAGASAFLAVVDTYIELREHERMSKRRVLSGRGRIFEVPTMIYELQDSTLIGLGDPNSLSLEEVKKRLLTLLDTTFKTTAEVLEICPQPKPSRDTATKALNELAEERKVERDPPIAEGKAKGKTYRYRRSPNFTSDGPS